MVIFLRLLLILCLLVVVVLAIANTLWFNDTPETHKHKSLQAFNVLALWIVTIVLVIKILVM